MAKYVQVLDNVVVNIVELDSATYKITEKHEHVGKFIDITDITPVPDINWTCNKKGTIFLPPELSDVKHEQKAVLDVVAGAMRRNLINTAAGQSEIYTAKALEAEQYISNKYPKDLTMYPWIQIEVTASSTTARKAANMIKAKHDTWLKNLQNIELEKRIGKINIDSANEYYSILAATQEANEKINGLKF